MLLRHHVHSTRLCMKQCSLLRIPHHTRESHWKCCIDRRRTSRGTSTSPGQAPILSHSGNSKIRFHNERRCYSSQEDGKPREIAILGGGVTGMASAYFLAETFPDVKVVIFDNKDTLGGWIRSSPVDVGDGEVIFEQGPRSLRPAPPNGTLALRLIQDLELVDDLLITPKTSPAATNRFVYYPDHLVRMPGPGESLLQNLRTIFFEPVFDNILRGAMKDAATDPRGVDLEDESVGSFIERRFHKSLANNLASAIFHGIYAGNIWKLSAKSILSLPWAREAKYGDLVSAFYDQVAKKRSWNFCDEIELQMTLQNVHWDEKIRRGMLNCSVFTFKKGIGQLAQRLQQRLEEKENVTVMHSTNISSIQQTSNSDIQVTYSPSTSDNTPQTTTTFTHLISTIAPRHLLPHLKTTPPISTSLSTSLGATTATTVLVVNLYYRTPALLTKISPPGGLPRTSTGFRGFGYLIPSSVPFSQNPERALGVIFDSDISPDLWTSVPEEAQGTKLTVMLGGHWWDGWSSYPDEEEAKEMAMNVLARHLGIVEMPVAVRATLQENCIPQYHVGHSARMARGHDALLGGFAGRVRVAGSWFTGVGVNDCLRGAWEVVRGLASDLSISGEKMEERGIGGTIRTGSMRRDGRVGRGQRTGLENFKNGRPMVLVRRSVPGELEVIEVDRAGADMGFFGGVRVSGEKEE